MQTPFADKICTNYVPLRSEIQQIHQVIAQPLDDIFKLDEKIVHFQAIIDELSQERDKLSKFVEDHRALLSGARRLPHELVQEIFLYCLPTDRNAVMSSDEAPILLGRICKFWRQISLSTPQLWSSLHIPIPEPAFLTRHGRAKLLQRGEGVKAWLELSGSCPLSISFVAGYGMEPREEAESSFAASHLFLTIMPFSKRWENMDIILPLSVYESCLCTLGEADVPVLSKIRFNPSVRPSFWEETFDHAPIFWVPSLRHVNLRSLDFATSSFTPRWERLIHLELTGGTWGRRGVPAMKALQILNQSSQLISCILEIESRGWASTSAIITLPSLRSLELITDEEVHEGYAGFCNALMLPALLDFRYSVSTFPQEHSIMPFKSILTQPHTPGIESVAISVRAISKEELISHCLPLLSSLKRLTLTEAPSQWGYTAMYEGSVLDNDLLALLTPSAGSEGCLCPSLEEIRMENCIGVTEDAIRPFLTARTRLGATRLKRARFSFPHPRMIDIIPELQPLMAEGLEVRLDYPATAPGGGPCSPRRGLQYSSPQLWTM